MEETGYHCWVKLYEDWVIAQYIGGGKWLILARENLIDEKDLTIGDLILGQGERSEAFLMVMKERKRQIQVEGHTLEHDDEWVDGELSEAGACYAGFEKKIRTIDGGKGNISIDRTWRWPWNMKWWKPSPEDRVKELTKAAALIIADIERILRIKKG
jgi:hypothetical protein